MNHELIADEIIKRIINSDTRHRIAAALFSPVPVARSAIKRPLRELVKASCPVTFKTVVLKEVEQSVIDALKNYGIKVSKR